MARSFRRGAVICGGAVRQVDLQVEIAVAVGPQLFFRGQKDLIDRLLMSQLTDEPPCHGKCLCVEKARKRMPPAEPGILEKRVAVR